jgi:hypothetical protein
MTEWKNDAPRMKTAFALVLVALMVVPALATARIMLWSARRRQAREIENGHKPEPDA